jgi:sortase (surface protein transpeptidase)
MKKRFVWIATGMALIIFGTLLGLPAFLQSRENAGVPKVAASPFEQPQEQLPMASDFVPIEGRPIRIEIPSLGINLEVADGNYNQKTQKWTLSTNKAHFATLTPMPNNVGGNTLIYGHNRKEVFKTLSRIQLGAEAIVTTENDHRFVYVFKGALETVPTDDSLFRYKGTPILTVQTCSGVFYENRQLFTFDLKEAV